MRNVSASCWLCSVCIVCTKSLYAEKPTIRGFISSPPPPSPPLPAAAPVTGGFTTSPPPPLPRNSPLLQEPVTGGFSFPVTPSADDAMQKQSVLCKSWPSVKSASSDLNMTRLADVTGAPPSDYMDDGRRPGGGGGREGALWETGTGAEPQPLPQPSIGPAFEVARD